jgi:hypothetical protein
MRVRRAVGTYAPRFRRRLYAGLKRNAITFCCIDETRASELPAGATADIARRTSLCLPKSRSARQSVLPPSDLKACASPIFPPTRESITQTWASASERSRSALPATPIARRVASRGANVNLFLPGRNIGEGQGVCCVSDRVCPRSAAMRTGNQECRSDLFRSAHEGRGLCASYDGPSRFRRIA